MKSSMLISTDCDVSPVVKSRPEGQRVGARLAELWREGWRYLAVSIVALAVDAGLFVLLVRFFDLHYQLGNLMGFAAGVVVAYAGSVTWVFAARRFSNRWIEFAIFAAAGIGGLVIGAAILAAAVEWGRLAPEYGKVLAVCCSFAFNFLSRKFSLFVRPR